MNLDFSAEPAFSWYVVLLMVSGLAMVGVASVRRLDQSAGLRIFTFPAIALRLAAPGVVASDHPVAERVQLAEAFGGEGGAGEHEEDGGERRAEHAGSLEVGGRDGERERHADRSRHAPC